MFDYSTDNRRLSDATQRDYEQAAQNYRLAQAAKMPKPKMTVSLTTVTYSLLFVTCGAFVATVIQGFAVFS